MKPDPYEGREAQVRTVDAELDRQLLAQSRAVAGNASRATVLIAAAGITLSFATAAQAPISLVVLAGVFGLTAVACGIVALWPHHSTEHDVAGMLDDVWNATPGEAVHLVLARKLETRNLDGDDLFQRARWVRYGFIAYAACLVTVTIGNVLVMELAA